MKISIIVCVGNEKHSAEDRNDPYKEAIESYHDLADEVVVVDGGDGSFDYGADKVVLHEWKYDWNWSALPKHLNTGLENASGDWVIRCDIDYVFHENDIKQIIEFLDINSHLEIVSFQKFSFSTADRYFEKGSVPIAINKGRVGEKIKFGLATNTKTDLCYPIYVEKDGEIPSGLYLEQKIMKCGKPVWNYDSTFRTKDFQIEEFWRFSKAYKEYFDLWTFGITKERAFNIFIDMMRGRYNRSVYKNPEHPKYIRDRIEQITPDQFGFNGWGLLEA